MNSLEQELQRALSILVKRIQNHWIEGEKEQYFLKRIEEANQKVEESKEAIRAMFLALELENKMLQRALEKERWALTRFLIPWRTHLSESWLKHFEESGAIYFDSIGYVHASPIEALDKALTKGSV